MEPGDEEFTIWSSHLRKYTFWKRWRNEYLVEPREYHQQHKSKTPTESSILLGAVVVVHDEGVLEMGKVEEVLPGRDGQIRGAVVRLGTRNQQSTLIRQPVQLLYPLEVQEATEVSDQPRHWIDRE